MGEFPYPEWHKKEKRKHALTIGVIVCFSIRALSHGPQKSLYSGLLIVDVETVVSARSWGNEMFEDEIGYHNQFSSGAALTLGKIHWYIQKANTEMEQKCLVQPRGNKIMEEKLTTFGEEVGYDEIHWWVFRKETQIEELAKRTKLALNAAQKLKEDSFSMKEKYVHESYLDLMRKLEEFTEQHTKEIDELYDYVVWLHKRDILAPSILFTYRVWGSTRLSERTIKITSSTLDQDPEMVKLSTEIALGIKMWKLGYFYILEKAHSEILMDIAEGMDPEDNRPISVPKQKVLSRASYEVLEGFAEYYEFLRQSLRNILLDIEKYLSQGQLLYSESFWKSFILKAKDADRSENQLWDFKKSLEMWHITGKKDKEKAEVEFSELVAGFANAKGGAIIVGITDEHPRHIVGVPNLENRLHSTKDALAKYIQHPLDFVHFQQIPLETASGRKENCLVIAMAETKDVISAKDELGKFSFPVRSESGLTRSTYERIAEAKRNLSHSNINFLLILTEFLKG